ncbi:Clp protease N-terminal domain-containing protein [Gemmata algarum]|uniref:Clp protease N-terminal domain-containing protein n=1 Tax=Gemmata algarum TaxID=2975278 RepID=UPI0039C93091
MVRIRYPEGPSSLSVRARKVFQLANQEAHRLWHHAVGVEHLLLGLAKEADSPSALALRAVGFDLAWLRAEVELRCPRGLEADAVSPSLPHTPELAALLGAVLATASGGSVTPVSLLRAILGSSDTVAGQILRSRRVGRWRLVLRLRTTVEPGDAPAPAV